MTRRHAPTVFLVLLSVAIILPRLLFSTCINEFGTDGGYYTDIALNLAAGNGLTTDVSIFHQAFPYFPYPTPVYPLWPLLYGAAAVVFPVRFVGVWLPTLFYFVLIGLSFIVGRRLAPRLHLHGVHGGHVFAVVTALTSEMMRTTSRPYTEGLGYTLLFLLFVRAPALFRRLGPVAGLELGAWIIALFLTRSPLIVVAIAAVGAVLVAAWRRPRAAATFTLAAAGLVTVVWQIYAAWLGTFLANPSLGTYVRFDLARASDLLSAVPVLVQTNGPLARLKDVASGFVVAFTLRDEPSSYYRLHHALISTLPIAALALLVRVRRARVLFRFLRSASAPNAAFFLLSALGLLGSLHTVHKVYGLPWTFGDRHALSSLFLVVTATLFLLRSRSWLHLVGALLLAAGTFEGWREMVLQTESQCIAARHNIGLLDYRRQLREFLLKERERRGSLTVAVQRPEAQRLGWRTPGVGFHWMTHTTTVDDLSAMVNVLGVRYVVLFDAVKDPFAGNASFAEHFTLATTFKERGIDEDGNVVKTKLTRVYAPLCAAFPTLAVGDCVVAASVP